jgi:hypothetical protein
MASKRNSGWQAIGALRRRSLISDRCTVKPVTNHVTCNNLMSFQQACLSSLQTLPALRGTHWTCESIKFSNPSSDHGGLLSSSACTSQAMLVRAAVENWWQPWGCRNQERNQTFWCEKRLCVQYTLSRRFIKWNKSNGRSEIPSPTYRTVAHQPSQFTWILVNARAGKYDPSSWAAFSLWSGVPESWSTSRATVV